MTKGNGGIRKDAAVFSLLDQFPEDGVPVEAALGEAGDLLAGLAEAEAALRQDGAHLGVRIGAAVGDDEGGEAVDHQPHIPEVAVRQRLVQVVDGHEGGAQLVLGLAHLRHGASLGGGTKEKQPVELGFLPGETQVLPAKPQEGDGLAEPLVGIAAVDGVGGQAQVRPELVHPPVVGEDGPGGDPQLRRDIPGGDALGPLDPGHPQGGVHDLVFGELDFRRHGTSSFFMCVA